MPEFNHNSVLLYNHFYYISQMPCMLGLLISWV